MVAKPGLYGPILGASGVQGFFGEGYWYHKWVPGLSFKGMTFVSKTTTLNAREGNMPLQEDGITGKEWLPSCVHVELRKGIALNSVGLSGPGAKSLFDSGMWQDRKEPFWISFMSVATHEDPTEARRLRREEFEKFLDLLIENHVWFQAPWGLQINPTCPNTEVAYENLVEEVRDWFQMATEYGIEHIMFKLTVSIPTDTLIEIARIVDSICLTNTVKFGLLPDEIDWEGIFPEGSPLEHLGGGGLSGRPLLQIVCNRIRALRDAGCTNHINGGGGILHPSDVDKLKDAGANSVFIGSVAFLRGWRVSRVIRRAHRVFDEKEFTSPVAA